ncbi:SRPBCC family protein [Sulfitobacter sp. S190]|uniref:SRPBCC family protein n=1 Tax=Sulfitobacter sp. S190 TaxID=2867022 RepID=UPI0021A7296D|nr:SRPBCC family protein [Sulfitobacter sp. S190]UWR22966.1 SRPBCC family protein [Sulfitobacter sp. S190]
MRMLASAVAFFAFTSVVAAEVAIPAPPDLASASKYQSNTETIVLNAPLAEAWQFWRDNPVTDFVEPTDRIPEIAGFEVLKGNWGEPGSIRRVTFQTGETALERVLTSTESEFSYQIWNIQTSSGRFINHIYGKFEAQPVESGTAINWSYNVKPAVFFARPSIASFIRNDFAPFMEGGLQGLSAAYTASQPG